MIPFSLYSRKSSEDSEHQIQSIPSQEKELLATASRFNLTVTKPYFSEAKSAKEPGRAVFNDLMSKVERGELKGILCWKLDRLARNPVDGARVIWAIKKNGLIVRTPSQVFSNETDNILIMYIEFGMAQKYTDDLSKITQRGLEDKAEMGWFPGIAPNGFLNSKVEECGLKTILCDPIRFHQVRRMWDLMLTGNYSPARIQKIANEEWGYRTRLSKKTGGKPISQGAVYQIFSNPFYYGKFEYPKGSGKWFQGLHKPMITKAEFDTVQSFIHRRSNPRPHKDFDLLYRGLFKCGECNSSVTAQYKVQVRCTTCHFKSSIKNKPACFNCGLTVEKMKHPRIRTYGYYHCSRTLKPSCRQKCITLDEMEKQLSAKLGAFGLPDELRSWGLEVVDGLYDEDRQNKGQITSERKTAFDQCIKRLENLVKLKTSPENSDNSLLSDEEYQKQRVELIAQKNSLSADTTSFEERLQAKARITKEALNVVGKIAEPSFAGDSNKKKQVLAALGLNHVMLDKNLAIKPEFPFCELPNDEIVTTTDSTSSEPDNSQGNTGRNDQIPELKPTSVPGLKDVRTKKLRKALKRLWKQVEPWAEVVDRSSLFREPSELLRLRDKNGKFVANDASTDERHESDERGIADSI